MSGWRSVRAAAVLLAAAIVAGAGVVAGAEGPKRVGRTVAPVKRVALPAQGVEPADADSVEALKYKALSVSVLRNGDFEQGRWWPEGWEPVDGLSSFWEAAGGTAGKRCLRHDTNVLNEQGVKWNAKVRALVEAASKQTGGRPQSLRENPVPPAPKRLPTRPPYYNTLGGLEGVIYLTEPIPHRRGAIYRITVDARTEGGGAPIVFLKGYFTYEGRERNCGRLEFHLNGIGKEWKRFSRLVWPEKWSSRFGGYRVHPEYLKAQLFSYWTVGDYWYDNVKLEIVGWEPYEPTPNPKDLEKLKAEEEKGGEKAPVKEDPGLGEGEFPEF
jgi:hypothetical protein